MRVMDDWAEDGFFCIALFLRQLHRGCFPWLEIAGCDVEQAGERGRLRLLNFRQGP